MKEGQKLSSNSKRRKSSMEFWLKVAKDYNDDIAPEDIAKKYRNPVTKKSYNTKHIYWILRKLGIKIK